MKRLIFSFAFAVLAVVASPACSSSDTCEDSKCAAGNRCIDEGGGARCRLLCTHSDIDAKGGCPSGYHCAPAPDKVSGFCKEDKYAYPKSEYGQWGHHCNAPWGLDQNPDCDYDNYFWCFGRSPTDGDAYCTQFQCADDTDCTVGFYCGAANLGPSVQTVKPTFGASKTTTVCLKRDYCAPCEHDFDCPSYVEGGPSHCIAGTDGKKFCSNECSKDSQCHQDAKCAPAAGVADVLVCQPLAGVCVGDGSLCSPCRSDVDCPNGVCVEQPYSHEHYCTVKSTTPCQVVDGKLVSSCPKTLVRGDNTHVSCATTTDIPTIPKDNCFGITQFGTNGGDPSYIDGCWTKPKLE